MGLGMGCAVCGLRLENLGVADRPIILHRGVGYSTKPHPKRQIKGKALLDLGRSYGYQTVGLANYKSSPKGLMWK